MKKHIAFSFCCAALMVCAGCSLLRTPDFSEPAYYDLASCEIPPAAAAPSVEFRSFDDATGNGLRIVRRLADGKVAADDLNRFSAPPEQLIRRRLIEYFPFTSGKNTIRVNGRLCRFEADERKGKAVMVMDYLLHCHGKNKALRHKIEVKTSGKSGARAAAALEECVVRSARRLAGELIKFNNECVRQKEKK